MSVDDATKREAMKREAMRARLATLSPEKQALLAQKLVERSNARGDASAADRDRIVPRNDSAPAPLSHAQELLWLYEQIRPGTSAYNFPMARRVRGQLDVAALGRAFNVLVARHESLRTAFTEVDGVPAQHALPASVVEIEFHDLRAMPASQRESAGMRHMQDAAVQPFVLANGTMPRVVLVQLADSEFLLLVVVHHIVFDGGSIGVFFRELATAYASELANEPSSLPALTVQLADFATWERRTLNDERLAPSLEFWREYLNGAPSDIELPTDFPRLPTTTGPGARYAITLPVDTKNAVHALASGNGVTPFMVLFAAFQSVLYRHSGQSDFTVGTVIAGRSRPETETMLGYLANTLAVRARITDDVSFATLLKDVQRSTLRAFDHQEVAYERIVRELKGGRPANEQTLFGVVFALQETGAPSTSLGAATLEPFGVELGAAKFDISVSASERPDGLRIVVEYRSDLFAEDTVARMVSHLDVLTRAAAHAPQTAVSRLPLLTSTEQHLMLQTWNDTEASWPTESTLHEVFGEQARRRPDAIAVECDGVALTYAQLDKRSNRLAWQLRARGVGRDSLVAVCMEKSADLVAVLLGILKAGGAYVPMDPAYPDDRLAFMLSDSGAQVVVTEAGVAHRVSTSNAELLLAEDSWRDTADARDDAPPSESRATDLCYVIYTSGSTGRPKGVLIEHQNVVRLLINSRLQFSFNDSDVWTVFHSFSFDFSVWEMYGALLYGGRLVVVPRQVAQQPAEFLKLLQAKRVTVLNQVPTAFYALMQETLTQPFVPLSLRYIVFGGEALQPALLKEWKQRYPDTMLVNMFGITETTVHVTFKEIGDAEIQNGASNIGGPIPTLSTYVLDQYQQLVPIGATGELCVGGAGVARGYLNRPDLTAERFVKHPFRDGERLYRSGDLGRLRASGDIEYLGRRDLQVKLRGFRIELGEIEATLAQHANITACVCTIREDGTLGARLVAYYVTAADTVVDLRELREWLGARLPEFMVPAAFMQLPALPMTSNGKVDRKALPAPTDDSEDVSQEYVAPRTAIEEKIAAVWGEVLGRERISVDADFFALGGHSLLAMRVVAGLAAVLPVRITISSLWKQRTVATLATLVEETIAAQQAGNHGTDDRIVPRANRGAAPISYAQELLWLYEQMTPGTAAYNIPLLRRVRGPLNLRALQVGLNAVVARHESLRTQFVESEGTPQQVAIDHFDINIEVFDVQHLPADTREAEARRLMLEVAVRPFDLAVSTLPRAVVVPVAPDDAFFMLCVHHIVFDGVSAVVVLRELAASYEAALTNSVAQLPALPIQFADFASWERESIDAPRMQAAMSFWKEELKDIPVAVDVPTDFARPSGQVGPGARHTVMMTRETRDAVRAFAKAQDSTLFMTLMAAFQTLLFRYHGQTDVVVGTAVAGRDRPETSGVVGYLANALAVRANLAGDPTFTELLRQVRERTVRALEHQHVPLEEVVRELRGDLPASEQALFRVVLTLQDASTTVPRLGNATLEPVPLDVGAPKFDIYLSVNEFADGIRVVAEYRSDLYLPETIAGMLHQFETLLSAAAQKPDTPISLLPLMSAEERALVLTGWNNTAAPYPVGRTMHDLISEQAARTPDAVALVGGNVQLTYAEMEKRANELAAHLKQLGVTRGEMVGVMAERLPETVVNILAILKAGAAYVPLDPTFPAERLAFVANDTGFRFLLGRRPAKQVLGDATKVTLVSPDERATALSDDERVVAAGSNLAYVIFTSGSTGRPKGVMVTHENLTVSTWARVIRYREPVSRYLMLSSFAFDSSVAGLFWTLLQGGALVVPGDDEYMDAVALCTLLREQKISHLLGIPSFLMEIFAAASEADLRTLRVSMTGGDWCPVELIQRHFALAPHAGFYTEYGPTETTVWCSVLGIEPGDAIPRITIGNPMPNYTMYILDARGEPLPIGVTGEIYIGGLGVSNGYLGRRDLNETLFIADPFNPVPNSRMYRTGERGRWLANGEIEFRGRIDFQVKVRGYRVELKEIEVTIGRHPSVAQAAVVLRKERGGEVVAYVVRRKAPDSDAAFAEAAYRDELRSYLATRLPEYMVPSTIVLMDALPVTSSGKMDRNALPAPQSGAAVVDDPPLGAIEEVVASVWTQALQVDSVGRTTSFFELGGHSLLVTRVVAALAKLFRIHLPIRAMFDSPTVCGLAAALVAREPAPGQSERVAKLVLKLQAQAPQASANAPTNASTASQTDLHA